MMNTMMILEKTFSKWYHIWAKVESTQQQNKKLGFNNSCLLIIYSLSIIIFFKYLNNNLQVDKLIYKGNKIIVLLMLIS